MTMRMITVRERLFPADAPYEGLAQAEALGFSLARMSRAMARDGEGATFWLCELVSPVSRHEAVFALAKLSARDRDA